MHTAGIEFGSHTVSHPKLVDLPWAEIESELSNSKLEIERQLGCPVSSFAYPYAFPEANNGFVTRFLEVLRETGYESCVTTRIGCARPEDNPLTLRRLPANGADDEALFGAKLDGGYDWLATGQTVFKALQGTLGARGRGAN